MKFFAGVTAWLAFLLLVGGAYWRLAPVPPSPARLAAMAERDAAETRFRDLVGDGEVIVERRIRSYLSQAADEADRREREAWAKANRGQFADEDVAAFIARARLARDEAEGRLAAHPAPAPPTFVRALAVVAAVQGAATLVVLLVLRRRRQA